MSAKLIKFDAATALAFAPFSMPDAAFFDGAQMDRAPRAPSPFIAGPKEAKSQDATNAARDEAEASQIIAEAQREAERIISDARARTAAVEDEARRQGIAEAQAAVAAQVAQEVEPLRAQLVETLEELACLRSHIAARSEQELVSLAIEIAKKIVRREVTIDREIALTLARVALSRLHARSAAAVHLHPEDYAYARERLEQFESCASIELVEDRTISRGGCLIRTESGDVDARIEQQFATIERSFLSEH